MWALELRPTGGEGAGRADTWGERFGCREVPRWRRSWHVRASWDRNGVCEGHVAEAESKAVMGPGHPAAQGPFYLYSE